MVFEVGGVINLDRQPIVIRHSNLTLAGQTAPAPGITLVKGGLTIRANDVIVRHIGVRPGEAGQPKRSGWECDGITVYAAHDVIVDHCSCTWATDENLSASGPRFEGSDVAAWRSGTSHRITFTNNIVAEGLSNSTHSKGEHSKGTLIHDNVRDVLVFGSLYASNKERNPLLKGGASAVVANNLIWNPGTRSTSINLHSTEWAGHASVRTEMTQVGNVLRAGPSTDDDVAMAMLGGTGEVLLHQADNLAFAVDGSPLPQQSRYGREATPVAVVMPKRPPLWPAGFSAGPAAGVQAAVLANAGSRPWDRDPIDARIIADLRAGRGRLIDSETEAGGYPVREATRQAFDAAAWDLDTMERRA